MLSPPQGLPCSCVPRPGSDGMLGAGRAGQDPSRFGCPSQKAVRAHLQHRWGRGGGRGVGAQWLWILCVCSACTPQTISAPGHPSGGGDTCRGRVPEDKALAPAQSSECLSLLGRMTVWLSTAPTEPLTHWYQVRCLFQSPLFAKAGDTLSGTCLLIANKRWELCPGLGEAGDSPQPAHGHPPLPTLQTEL